MSLADDPRLTAYADGALPKRESRRFERELARDPAAQSELEEFRALQDGLRAAFADPASPAAAIRPPRTPPPVRAPRGLPAAIGVLFVAIVVLIVGATLFFTAQQPRAAPDRVAAMTHLRRIHTACLIYAADNGDKFPVASDIWDFARQLALAGGLNDARAWTIEGDPAAKDDGDLTTVLAADGVGPHPEFAAAKPAFGAVLAGIDTSMPATTPILWTRGLREDGTWAPDNPFGDQGGYVLFLGGEIRYFFNGHAKFVGRDGQPTSRLRDALPEGSRTGEYTPTSAESRLWSVQPRPPSPSALRAQNAQLAFFSGGVLVLTGAGVWQIARRRVRVGELLMATLVALLLGLLGLAMR
jgi:Predicted transmembrane transcriptional regulator (anti-sigma factor)